MPSDDIRAGTHAVRSAQESDVVALAALINEAYLVESHFVSGPRTTEAEVAAMVERQEFLVLDAQVQDRQQLVACARLHFHAGVAKLGLISVIPTLQGQGLGQRMIAVAEGLARAAGAERMELQVVNLREELRGFYRHLGYLPTGTSVFDDTKATIKEVHFVDMVKELAPA